MTDLELMDARANEAVRLVQTDGTESAAEVATRAALHMAVLIRDEWMPPPKIDPVLAEAREIIAKAYEGGLSVGSVQHLADQSREGRFDDHFNTKCVMVALRKRMAVIPWDGELNPAPECMVAAKIKTGWKVGASQSFN